MNFQEKIMERSADLRERAAAFATATVKATRRRVDATAGQITELRKSLSVLNAARGELGKVARRHAGRFIKQNSPLLTAVRRDVSELARSTYQTLTTASAPKTKRESTSRKRSRKAA